MKFHKKFESGRMSVTSLEFVSGTRAVKTDVLFGFDRWESEDPSIRRPLLSSYFRGLLIGGQ